MAGRRRDVDVGRVLARAVRGAALAARPDAVLVGEHSHDARTDLQGDGWHGTMAYMGFTRPVWCLAARATSCRRELQLGFLGLPVAVPRLGGTAVTATMRRFRAGVPWRSDPPQLGAARQPRHRAVPRRQRLARAPRRRNRAPDDDAGRADGVRGRRARARGRLGRGRPADDALGPARAVGRGAARGVPHASSALRGSSTALARGGIRFAHVGTDAIAYLRETRDERLLCLAVRAATDDVRAPARRHSARPALEPLFGGEARLEGGAAVLPGDGPAFHVWRLR